MNTAGAPRSIDLYLKALREALAGEDRSLIQDALYDAEEYLRAEIGANPGKSESDVLELIASTYGAPGEVAEAYRTTEKQVRAALAPPKPRQHRTALGRFFGVYAESRTWTALFYSLLAIGTGIVYFTVTVTGLSLSLGLAILIIGIPFFLLFVGFTRVLALAEGRLVEGLLGQRMPRRPTYPQKGKPVMERIKAMLADRRTWTTMLYFLLMLPLGILYFTVAITGLAAGLSLILGPLSALLFEGGGLNIDGVLVTAEPAIGLIAVPLGILLLTLVLHLIRGIGTMHGSIAKHLLVAQSRDD
jgi:uncharacterized membrane protein